MSRAAAGDTARPGALEARVGYAFLNRELLQDSLAHRSYANEGGRLAESNERLEFLGDAVIQFVVSERLFRELAHLSEGELTRARAALVNRHALAEAGRHLGLDRFVLLGKGARAAGMHLRESILADTFEALVAAVYLDGGADAAAAVLWRGLEAAGWSANEPATGKDFKSMLQELTQADAKVTPAYELIGGDASGTAFTVRVVVSGRALGEGTGRTRASAEQAAAEQALSRFTAARGVGDSG